MNVNTLSHWGCLGMTAKESKFTGNHMAAAGDFNKNVPDLQIFSLVDIEAATERFSIENKLGQGGYGPVYKVNISKKKFSGIF